MNILLIGSGGREHAIAWKLKQSNKLSNLFVAPGNAGTLTIATNVDINGSDFETIKKFVLDNAIHFVIVGPEQPLVDGIKDFFKADSSLQNIPVIGPSKVGAMLEGSKDFAKAFMQRQNIPTARYQTFTKATLADAYAFLQTLTPPYVLKADGLAAGKGVVILNDIEATKKELQEMFSGKFGNAGNKVVIEEFLDGIEMSVFVLTDGKSYVVLPEAKDYKRIGDNDAGPNTGGMGSVSPVPFANKEFMAKVEEQIIKPTMAGIRNEKIDYSGFIFIGLIKVGNNPFVIEYNVRMGDPETQSVFPRIQNDCVELFHAVALQKLDSVTLNIDPRTATTVVLVAEGYPGDYRKGDAITGIENVTDSLVFHAGTVSKEGKVLSSGGRVLNVVSFGNSIDQAIQQCYQSIDKIHYQGKYFRRDIGMDLKKL